MRNTSGAGSYCLRSAGCIQNPMFTTSLKSSKIGRMPAESAVTEYCTKAKSWSVDAKCESCVNRLWFSVNRVGCLGDRAIGLSPQAKLITPISPPTPVHSCRAGHWRAPCSQPPHGMNGTGCRPVWPDAYVSNSPDALIYTPVFNTWEADFRKFEREITARETACSYERLFL